MICMKPRQLWRAVNTEGSVLMEKDYSKRLGSTSVRKRRMCHDSCSCRSHLFTEQCYSSGSLIKLLPLHSISLQSQVSQHLSQIWLWSFSNCRQANEARNRNRRGRMVWAHLQVDGRRTLSCGVPFWIQAFHRLKLDLLQGTEAWGAVTPLHSLLQPQKWSAAFPTGSRETSWQPSST